MAWGDEMWDGDERIPWGECLEPKGKIDRIGNWAKKLKG